MQQELRRSLNRLALKILVFDAAILVAMIALALLITKQSKQRLADQLSEAFRAPLLAGDTRQILQDMSRPVYKDFLGFAWKTSGGTQDFLVPEDLGKPGRFIYGSVKIPVFFDEERKINAGILWFYYPKWTALPTALLAWLFLVGLSVAVMYFERTRLMREYRAALETEANRLKADLAAQVAHDIRSPLAALGAAAKGLELPAEQRALVDGAVARMQGIADDLLKRYRAPGAEVKSAPKGCDLAALVGQVAAEKRLQYKDRSGVKIVFEKDGEVKALADAKEFQRIVSNLVNNSVEAFDKGGTVVLKIFSAAGRARLEIVDDGKGIPPEILAKLGEKGGTHGKAGGTGLGVYHAKSSVESWGGNFNIKSEPGKGTAVTIELPLAAAGRPAGPVFLLDDDALVHMNWRAAARKAGAELKACKTAEELRAALANADKDAAIYIDSELGDGVKGEDVATELHDKGFLNITMATGHDAENFAHLKWLKAAGKEPPWQ